MPSARHRHALMLTALWATVLGCYPVSRHAGGASTTAPSTPGRSTHLSASVDSWQAFPLKPMEEDGGRTGIIRVGRNADGLVICGTVHGSDPAWPKPGQPPTLHDHLEIRLADGTPAVLPPIGWGNQFGFIHPQAADDDTDLHEDNPDRRAKQMTARKTWYEAQLPYRELVTRLFEREWHIAPGRVDEVAATTAMAALPAVDQQQLSPLSVRGTPAAAFSNVDGAAYTFEILIPWEAFPPMRSLSVQDIRLLVTTVSPELATGPSPQDPHHRSSRRSAIDGASALIPLRLASAREYLLTPCRFSLSDANTGVLSDAAIRYIRPGRDAVLDQVVVMDNTAQGYQYEPASDSRSPIAAQARFWSRPLADGGLLGGPRLTWSRNGTTVTSNHVIDEPEHLEFRVGADGDVLIRYGPRVAWSYFGSGQCGACPRLALGLFRLRRTDQAILNPLSLYEVVQEDGEMAITPDWRVATYYEAGFDVTTMTYRWQQIDHVRSADGSAYVKQPARTIAAPPEPRRFGFGDGK